MNDILIDTNILMHANNSHEKVQGDCIALLEYLLTSSELICIDKEINIDRSMILHEYFDNLKTPGTLGRNFIEKILNQKRFKPISRHTEHRVTKIVNQHINRDKHVDKIFIKATYNSEDKTLVSHDYEDFQDAKRDFFRRYLNIHIIQAKEVL
jgi:hypothetical protein